MLFFFRKFFSFISSAEKTNHLWKKLYYIINIQYLPLKKWFVECDGFKIHWCDMAKYGSSMNLFNLWDWMQSNSEKNLCTHAANILVLKVCHYKGNSMRTSSGIFFLCICIELIFIMLNLHVMHVYNCFSFVFVHNILYQLHCFFCDFSLLKICWWLCHAFNFYWIIGVLYLVIVF